MDKNSPQSPTVLGMRTFQDDLKEEHDGVVLPKAPFTTPENSVELNHAPTISQGERKKKLFDVESAYNDNHVQEGTIVTDKRRSKRSIGTLLSTAFNEWLDVTGESVRNNKDKFSFLKPKVISKVEVAEERRSTIQEAAQFAKHAPHDDHAEVIEKIKTLAKDAEIKTGKPFVLKPAPQKIAAWSHTNEVKPAPLVVAPTIVEGENAEEKTVPALESAQILKTSGTSKHSLAAYAAEDSRPSFSATSVPELTVSPQAKSLSEEKPLTVLPRNILRPEQSSYAAVPQERLDLRTALTGNGEDQKKRIEADAPQPTPRWGDAELPHLEPIPAPTQERIYSVPAPTPPPTPVSIPVKVPLATPTPVSASAEIATPARAPIPSPRPSTSVAASVPHRSVAPILRNVLLFSLLIAGVSLSLYAALMFVQSRKAPAAVETPLILTVPTFFTADIQKHIQLPVTRLEFLESLQNELQSAPEGITQLHPVRITPQGEVAVTANEVLEVLLLKISPVFIRNVKDPLVLGVLRDEGTAPYILLRVLNFDVAFAGMLEWEENMSQDLTPFFGETVTETLLPRNIRTLGPPQFVDALASNQSIRILYDGQGEERIVYAFVNSNTLVITSTTNALTTILERIR